MRVIILSLYFVFLTKDAIYKCTALLGLNNGRNYIEYMYCLFKLSTAKFINREFGPRLVPGRISRRSIVGKFQYFLDFYKQITNCKMIQI